MSHLVLSPGLVQFVGCKTNEIEEKIRNGFCCFCKRNETSLTFISVIHCLGVDSNRCTNQQ